MVADSDGHTRATEFSRVWVWIRVGHPQLTIYPTTDFLKHLILSYSLKIKLNACKNNSILHVQCKIYMQDYMQILNYL